MNRSDGNKIITLGITGGIGVGKSTVTSILEHFGAKIIDCDKISKELSDRKDIIRELSISFGDTIIGHNNKLDRKILASLVFNDKKKLELLNSILHKKVIEEIYKMLNSAHQEDVCVIDAPIPVAEGFVDICDEIWTITAPKQMRMKRVIERDNVQEKDVLGRINSQLDDESYIKIAHKVIFNDGDIISLRKQVKMYWADLIGFRKGQVDS